MSAIEYYSPTGNPFTLAPGTSAVMRSEFSLISTGFGLLPNISGNANKAVVINGTATGLTTTTGQLELGGDFITTGPYSTTLTQTASVTLGLPAVNGTLATLAGTETLTNKTLVSPIITGTPTGAVVSSFNTRQGVVTLTLGDVTGVGGAPQANPVFTGDPQAPTQALSDSDTSIATTAFVHGLIAAGAQIVTGDTPPVSPPANTLWWDSVGTQLYLWYNDGTSTQWVPATNQQGALSEAPNDGGTYARQNAAWVATSRNDIGRNLVQNPLFNVQQRGTGPWTASSAYTADRWLIGLGGSDTASFSIVALTDAERTQIGDEQAKWSLRNAFNGSAVAGSTNYFTHRIEDVRRLAGKTCTLSLYARRITGSQNPLGLQFAQNFGSGGTPSGTVYTVIGTITPFANTWTRYSFTFTVPSVQGMTFGTQAGTDFSEIEIICSSTFGAAGAVVASGTAGIWGVQLEIGNVATPLEKPDPADDLRRCQRFMCQGFVDLVGYQSAGTGFGYFMPFPVTMRAAPASVTYAGQAYVNASGLVASALNTFGFMSAAVATALGPCSFNATWTASADL